ncbi:MAG TPA: glycerate kinase [Syntrophobacteraceae bacterium]|nr:glycerate kinase [Syntrophobacteraceae bacterium]
MHIVVAPDSYKGSLSAVDAADAIERGVLSVFPDARVTKVPMADGGEGTAEVLIIGAGGHVIRQEVTGPLGELVDATWGILGDGKTGVIEMAAASGLMLIPEQKRDPRLTTTYGTGQLIRAALDLGIRRIIIGIGGSATNDGGAGMAQALGVRFLDDTGTTLPHGGASLARLASVDLSGLDPRLKETEILVACDVDNPLCGPQGASAVYGPQKGASPSMVVELDGALKHYARVARRATGKDVTDIPGAGAAGGLGAGLLLFTQAKLRSGVDIVLEATSFADIVQHADLVITGEGNTDVQTAHGKAPLGVARVARQFDVPVVCLSGGLGEGSEAVLEQGIDALMSIMAKPASLDECMATARELLQAAAARVCRIIRVGMRIGSSSLQV